MALLPPSATRAESTACPLPMALAAQLAPHTAALLTWMRQLHDAEVRERCADHPLVQLVAVLDLTSVEQQCASFYHASGPGAPPTYSVAFFLRAEIVRAWYGACSDRVLEDLFRTNCVVRWFCGLAFDAPGPDHATLQRFSAWLMQHHPQALFAHGLQLIDTHMAPALTVQYADTFACHAHAASQAAVATVAGMAATIREELLRMEGPLTAAVWPAVPPCPRNVPAAIRPGVIDQVCWDAVGLLATLKDERLGHAPEVRRRLAVLAHTVETTFVCGADGVWVERAVKERGPFRSVSSTDVDCSQRVHGKSSVRGYNVALAVITWCIRSIVVATGSTHDGSMLPGLMAQEAARGDVLPSVLVMDAAAGSGKQRAAVAAATGGQTQVVAPLPATGASTHRYGPVDFVVSGDGQGCRCPGGQANTGVTRDTKGDGTHFRWEARVCAGCVLWERCRDPKADPKGRRSVYISDYTGTLRVAAAHNATAEGQAQLRNRWRVEAVIAWLVRYAGARRARCRGRAAVQYQLWMAALVVNLRCFLKQRGRRVSAGGVGDG